MMKLQYSLLTILSVFLLSCNNSPKIVLSTIDGLQNTILNVETIKLFKGYQLDTDYIFKSISKDEHFEENIKNCLKKDAPESFVFLLHKSNPKENSTAFYITGSFDKSLKNLFYSEYGQGVWHWKLNKINNVNIKSDKIGIDVVIEPITFALTDFLDLCCDEKGGYSGVKEKLRIQVFNE